MASSKKPTLDDFLKKGKVPPTKGRKAPPDYDIITPDMGYTKPTKKNQPVKLPTSKPAPGTLKKVVRGKPMTATQKNQLRQSKLKKK